MSIKILTVIYVLILAGIIFIADLRGTNYFGFINYIPFGDKWGHFCLMGMFSLLVNLALKAKTIQIWRIKYLLGGLIVSAVVMVEEFSQIFLHGRTFDLADLLFDFAGIILFGEIARIIYQKTARS